MVNRGRLKGYFLLGSGSGVDYLVGKLFGVG